ncbi:hypothetical protein NL676_020194 [Syzygium grande]|nr:hypothetical protein NL676_020194 [Syzygium grande]
MHRSDAIHGASFFFGFGLIEKEREDSIDFSRTLLEFPKERTTVGEILLKSRLSELAARSSRAGLLNYLPGLLPPPPHRYPHLEQPSRGRTSLGLSINCFRTSAGSLEVKRSVSSLGRPSECSVECERGNLRILPGPPVRLGSLKLPLSFLSHKSGGCGSVPDLPSRWLAVTRGQRGRRGRWWCGRRATCRMQPGWNVWSHLGIRRSVIARECPDDGGGRGREGHGGGAPHGGGATGVVFGRHRTIYYDICYGNEDEEEADEQEADDGGGDGVPTELKSRLFVPRRRRAGIGRRRGWENETTCVV